MSRAGRSRRLREGRHLGEAIDLVDLDVQERCRGVAVDHPASVRVGDASHEALPEITNSVAVPVAASGAHLVFHALVGGQELGMAGLVESSIDSPESQQAASERLSADTEQGRCVPQRDVVPAGVQQQVGVLVQQGESRPRGASLPLTMMTGRRS